MKICYLLQYAATRRLRSWEAGLTAERAVGDHGDSMSRTPGNHGMLDGSFFQMVKDLVANRWVRAGQAVQLFKIVHIEIADAP